MRGQRAGIYQDKTPGWEKSEFRHVSVNGNFQMNNRFFKPCFFSKMIFVEGIVSQKK